mgnify:CR=1 FL=1
MNHVRDIHVKLKLHRVCYSCLACAAAKTAEPRTSSHRERTMHLLPGDRLPCPYPSPTPLCSVWRSTPALTCTVNRIPQRGCNAKIDRFGSFWHPSTSALMTPLWAQNAHPKPVQERNGGVEGRFRYTEAGFNDYFNFPSSLRVNLIELQSGYAILALPNA